MRASLGQPWGRAKGQWGLWQLACTPLCVHATPCAGTPCGQGTGEAETQIKSNGHHISWHAGSRKAGGHLIPLPTSNTPASAASQSGACCARISKQNWKGTAPRLRRTSCADAWLPHFSITLKSRACGWSSDHQRAPRRSPLAGHKDRRDSAPRAVHGDVALCAPHQFCANEATGAAGVVRLAADFQGDRGHGSWC